MMKRDQANQPSFDRAAAVFRLQHIQSRSGLTKAAFAESIGISKSNYRMIEVGDRFLTVDQLYRLYLKFDVPMAYIVLGQEKDLPERYR